MHHKSFDIVETNVGEGTFEALVAVFGNVDLVGDRILPGAFSKSLERWRQSGDPIPIILSHQADDPMAHVGIADPNDVTETAKGLVVKGQLDVQDNEVAKQVHRLMKRRSLREFSFGYTIPKGGERRAKDGANELTEVDLFEVGPTLKGANPATELQAVKAAVEEKTPAPESSTMSDLVARMRELAQGDPPTPEAMLAFARRVMNDLSPPGGKTVGDVDRDLVESQVKDLVGDELWEKHHDNPVSLRRELEEAKQAALAQELFDPGEVEGLRNDLLKAVWSAAYINDLPDSAFLYVEPGGDKDGEGKTTPRSLRHFPYKDADGNVDLPHLRNALSRIPQSQSLSQDVKDRLSARAQRILDNAKSAPAIEDTRPRGPASRQGSEVQDPLRKRADALRLEFASDGLSLAKPPTPEPEPPKREPLTANELRDKASELMLDILTGDITE